ncbi:MAG: arginine--tRNA ligase [Anaerolineales bacterium]|nr:arginine--tRNA ligase [Anaerolineales bacterium]
MNSLLEKLTDLFSQAFVAEDLPADLGQMVVSGRPDLGDFQCNGALQGAREKKMNPRALAERIIAALPANDWFREVTIAGPGFINVRLNDAFLTSHLQAMIADENLGVRRVDQPQAIIVDYGGYNVAKALHVGHLRPSIIGQALANVLRQVGHHVIGDVHLGDWGLQMGQLIAELARRQPDLPYFDPANEGPFPTESPITLDEFGEVYPAASNRMKEDPEFAAAARQATYELQQGRPGYRALWQHFVDVTIADQKADCDRLGIHYDYWLGESHTDHRLQPMTERLIDEGYAVVSKGATIVDVSSDEDKKDLPPLMLLTSVGSVTYGTTDLATIEQRMEDFDPAAILYVVDKRQSLHFTQVFRAAYKTGIAPRSTSLEHIAFGTFNGKDGRPFKTRTGGVMMLKELVQLSIDAAYERMESAGVASDYPENEKAAIAEMVGQAALKFGDLVNHYSTDINFDLERFSSFEGRTGPYLLYSTVRTKSILRKAEDQGLAGGCLIPPAEDAERALLLKLAEMPEALLYTYETRSPNHLCEYIYNLSATFNRFLGQCHILREEDSARQASWLGLSSYFVTLMEMLLSLIMIDVPERM